MNTMAGSGLKTQVNAWYRFLTGYKPEALLLSFLWWANLSISESFSPEPQGVPRHGQDHM